MPAKQVYISKRVEKQLFQFPSTIQKRLLLQMDVIKKNPLAGTKLRGRLLGYIKIRVGDYRIIYSFNKKTKIVHILKIEHRQGVYK